jgi:hypothetical protein
MVGDLGTTERAQQRRTHHGSGHEMPAPGITARARDEVLTVRRTGPGSHHVERPRWRRLRSVAPLVVAALLLSSCSGYSGSVGHEVGQWAAAAGISSSNAEFERYVREIPILEREQRVELLKTVCLSLGTDVPQAYLQLPVPDNTITDELNVAYENLDEGAMLCYQSAGKAGSDVYRKTNADLDRGDEALERAARELAQLGVR